MKRAPDVRVQHSCEWLRKQMAIGAILISLPVPTFAADFNVPAELQRKIDTSIAQGVKWLSNQELPAGSGEGSLIAYALIKAKVSPESPQIVKHRDATLKKIRDGYYGSSRMLSTVNYEAACDAMLLESLDRSAYIEELTRIRDFLVGQQLESGAWYYLDPHSQTIGDTSITQYVILGLWAIHRAGIDVPREAWSRCAKYLSNTQKDGGGFSYHPGDPANSPNTQVTASMTAAGYGTALVTQLLLFGAEAAPQPNSPLPSDRKRFGVLEQLPDKEEEARLSAARKAAAEIGISRESFKNILPSAEKAVARLFEEGIRGLHPIYFLYGCERAGAVSGKDEFDSINWYESGVDYLLKKQAVDGSWHAAAHYGARVETSFALLFLTRATSTVVPRPKKRLVAGGLLIGGRGLPDDLNAVSVSGGEVKTHVPKGEVDQLLAALEQPTDVSLPDVTETLMESVSLDDPDQLIGQLPRLRQLTRHPDSEVRQVATWALARSASLNDVPLLISMLDDPDLFVAWEASLGLCVVSRLPLGVSRQGSTTPLPIAPPGVQEENPDPDLAKQWRKDLRIAWDAWYQRVRPYDERDDQRQIRAK